MASKPIAADKQYRVTLLRAVKIAPRVWARPDHDVVVAGSVLTEIKDAVKSYEEA